MRLGQIAREYEVPIQEIISFLEQRGSEFGDLHSNSKLDERASALVTQQFGPVEALDTPAPTLNTDASSNTGGTKSIGEIGKPEDASTSIPQEIETTTDNSGSLSDEAQVSIAENEEEIKEESIETDRLLEMLDSEETNLDLDKITLIKAPKQELEGLKVVGKIELKEPKPKEEIQDESDSSEEVEESNEDAKQDRRRGRNRQPQLSDEEREKRRLRAKRKKEEYEARQERRRLAQEKRKLKAKKEAHYKELVERNKRKQTKQKVIKEPIVEDVPEPAEERPEPNTIIGKLWRWLNSY